ncbi:MAG: hypothetical protein R2799_05625 [Crocinitomicaceae bacterium]
MKNQIYIILTLSILLMGCHSQKHCEIGEVKIALTVEGEMKVEKGDMLSNFDEFNEYEISQTYIEDDSIFICVNEKISEKFISSIFIINKSDNTKSCTCYLRTIPKDEINPENIEKPYSAFCKVE